MAIMILIALVCLAACGGTLPLNDNKTNVGGQGLPIHSLAQYLSQSRCVYTTPIHGLDPEPAERPDIVRPILLES